MDDRAQLVAEAAKAIQRWCDKMRPGLLTRAERDDLAEAVTSAFGVVPAAAPEPEKCPRCGSDDRAEPLRRCKAHDRWLAPHEVYEANPMGRFGRPMMFHVDCGDSADRCGSAWHSVPATAPEPEKCPTCWSDDRNYRQRMRSDDRGVFVCDAAWHDGQTPE